MNRVLFLTYYMNDFLCVLIIDFNSINGTPHDAIFIQGLYTSSVLTLPSYHPTILPSYHPTIPSSHLSSSHHDVSNDSQTGISTLNRHHNMKMVYPWQTGRNVMIKPFHHKLLLLELHVISRHGASIYDVWRLSFWSDLHPSACRKARPARNFDSMLIQILILFYCIVIIRQSDSCLYVLFIICACTSI